MSKKSDVTAEDDLLQTHYARHDGKISDKWKSYLEFFDEIFAPYKDQPIRILEIGIQNGGSLEIWARYFTRAEHIIGCDIAPAAAELSFADSRIEVIVGDANLPVSFSRIRAISDGFDIIIDDGSHCSNDIVRSFALYFSILREGGLYIAEDLHCAYWQEFQGGLEAPFSSVNFFKRLVDLVNREHWGGSLKSDAILDYYADTYGASFDAAALDLVAEVRFRNSLCAIKKGSAGGNAIGSRVVAGAEARVEPRTSIALNGTSIVGRNQSQNSFGPAAARIEALSAAAPDLEQKLSRALLRAEDQAKEISVLRKRAEVAENQFVEARAALQLARRYPVVGLRDKLTFNLLRMLARASGPLHRNLAKHLARSAARRDPDR